MAEIGTLAAWALGCVLLPLTWWLWGPALLVLALWRKLRQTPAQRAEARSRRIEAIEARSRRIEAAIRVHMLAHGLPDTPDSRARVLLEILRGGRR